jgi:serine/threonine protein kinase/tetratricopeptide (TPR) repeat protein
MNADEIFLAAAEKRDAAERAAYLDAECGQDAGLRARVEGLLRAHDAAGSFLEQPLFAMAATVDTPVPAERPGTVIGPYKLLQQLGEGGMGTVFMAEQTCPVQRKVALKIIKAGMDSRQVIARFEAERQALALMDHPNIARVLDGGTTETGRPYFVMELVKGVPITKFCDERRLTPRQRLELFVPVCEAVQHAHHKGVIHRDLKPSNVLVALYDGRAVPKVIDFGVAKAAGPKLTERTLFTEIGQVVGTLEYMSPEQAELNQLDIDTRSDVYSLGVLLYELLTGTTPLERRRLRQAALLEVLRLIREEEPPRPSTRLSTTEQIPVVAANRGVEPRKLSGLVRGELDWIVMKALEKDRNRRYDSATSLAQDVRRYLGDEPVQACPPSFGYRLRKRLRRHKGAVVLAAVLVCSLLAGTTGITVGLFRALDAERETGEALDRVTAEQARTKAALGQVQTEQANTKAALHRVTAEQAKFEAALLAAQNALDALGDDVVQTMFTRQAELGEAEKAFLRKVIGFHETVTRQMGDTPESQYLRAKGHYQVAFLRALLGEQEEAVAGYRRAVALLEPLAKNETKTVEYRERLAACYHNLGILLTDIGRATEAESSFRSSLALHEELARDFPAERRHQAHVAGNYVDLAVHLKEQNKLPEAEAVSRKALEMLEPLAAQQAEWQYTRMLARARSNHAQLFRLRGRPEPAEEYYQQAIEAQRKLVAEFPTLHGLRRDLADSCTGLAIVSAILLKGSQAEAAFGESLALRKKLAEDYPKIQQYRQELASVLHDFGLYWHHLAKYEQARSYYGQAADLQRALVAEAANVPRYQRELLRSLEHLGVLEWEDRQLPEAEKAWREAVNVGAKLVAAAPGPPEYRLALATVLGRLAAQQNRTGKFADAVELLQRARPHVDAALAAAPKDRAFRQCYRDLLITLAQSYLGMRDHSRLVPVAEELADCRFDRATDAFIGASMLATCMQLAGNDAALSSERRQELTDDYARRALVLLRRAVADGFKGAAQLGVHPDLAPLRDRDDFRKFLAEIDAKK